MSSYPTGSQTVGPFFELGLSWLYRSEIGPAAASGERVLLQGHVYDGAGQPVPDALLEFWQADARGRYHPEAEFLGFARVPTSASGAFSLRTIKPGHVLDASGRPQAPHLSVCVFMRGLLLPIRTRVYFSDEASNCDDPVLALVPEQRRATLIAEAGGDGFSWDLVCQGERETVCFSW
jgi:protocatechuate 3,4-dioxygenase alpha subunit